MIIENIIHGQVILYSTFFLYLRHRGYEYAISKHLGPKNISSYKFRSINNKVRKPNNNAYVACF